MVYHCRNLLPTLNPTAAKKPLFMSEVAFQTIAIAREIESPENPGGLEKRVAIIPEHVNKLCDAGLKVYVETGAGEGVGFSDQEYREAGAVMQAGDDIYRDKDLIVKFKGPALDSIAEMRPACTVFCMAHFHSFPQRARLLENSRINVIAMEEVLESPKETTDAEILSRKSMAAALQPFIENGSMAHLQIRVIGWSPALAGSIRRAGNRSPLTLQVIPETLREEYLDVRGEQALYFFDAKSIHDPNDLLEQLAADGTHIRDRAAFVREYGEQAIAEYRETHPPFEFGMRRIQCLHETGRAGARYGLRLLRENKPGLDIARAKVVVLGYGNVGSGAMHEIYAQGVERIHVLGRRHTAADHILPYLAGADLIVNGAEQPYELRGKNYLITREHVKNHIPDGSVVIDLVGGSPTNRSPVENVMSCTFLTDPVFVEDGVSISSLWGWPMMGMMRETAIRYSGQILDVLIGRERLVDGLGVLAPGVRHGLVCGPFSS